MQITLKPVDQIDFESLSSGTNIELTLEGLDRPYIFRLREKSLRAMELELLKDGETYPWSIVLRGNIIRQGEEYAFTATNGETQIRRIYAIRIEVPRA